MRISDWSSDVCSSDLEFDPAERLRLEARGRGFVGDELQQAAQRTRAIERALRAAQHLDPRDIETVEIAREFGPVGQPGARPVRRLVDIDRAGRGDPAGIAAAQHTTALPRRALHPSQSPEERLVGEAWARTGRSRAVSDTLNK